MEVRWELSAKQDLEDAKKHKENSPRTNVEKFIRSMVATANSLNFMPNRNPQVPTRRYRYIIDKTYEYRICYEVIDDTVHILYIQHPKENRR